MMRFDIDRGLKPNEALQVVLTAEDKKRYKIKNSRIVDRLIKGYLKDRKLPQTVFSVWTGSTLLSNTSPSSGKPLREVSGPP
jgi:hypothetical protein